MGQKKLKRFAEIRTFGNVLEYPENMKGNWRLFFKTNYPITLELACGRGEYAVGMARLYPKRNFIGVDIKGNRIWLGAKTALKENLNNAVFLRTQVEKITDYFNEGEVEELWLTFPDPQLRGSRAKKRLTHPRFLRLYQNILSGPGIVNLKTDSPDLYQFTLQVIDLFKLELLQNTDNIYSEHDIKEELKIKTHYENLDIAQSNRVHYLRFALNAPLPPEKDEQLKQMISE